MINPVYILSEEERKRAEELGRARNNAKDETIRYKRSGWIKSESKDRAMPHILGIAGEIAYAALTNQKVDEEIYKENKGDLMDFDGIEIKTSTFTGEDIELKIPPAEYKRKHPRAYVLARIDDEYKKVEFIGSISREKFDRIKYEKKHIINNLCVVGSSMSKGLAFVEDGVLKIVKFGTK